MLTAGLEEVKIIVDARAEQGGLSQMTIPVLVGKEAHIGTGIQKLKEPMAH